MKIGILTFHWATNYGAVLQAYSLQEFLNKMGHQACIINYTPFTAKKSLKACFKSKNPKNIVNALFVYLKEKRFVYFRNQYLCTTNEYNSLAELQKNPPNFDAYICGSDQIWNPYFLANGEKKLTPSYFLPFGNEQIIRIAYAPSFGCQTYPEALNQTLAAELQKFSHLSVRENSGKEILKNIGIPEVEIMPDPALLFEEKKLHDIISTEKEKKNEVFFYILQNKQHNIQQLLSYCKQQLKLNTKKANTRSLLSIEQWLCCFRDTKLVVTNSFHGIVFSILFQKPFVAIPIEGKFAGMNDRIYTLLEKFELTDRILEQHDKQKFIDIKNKPIDWEKTEKIKTALKQHAFHFLKKALEKQESNA